MHVSLKPNRNAAHKGIAKTCITAASWREMHLSLKPQRNAHKLIGKTGIIAASWREIHLSMKPKRNAHKLIAKTGINAASWTEIHVSLKPYRNAHHCCLLEREKCLSLKPKRKWTSHYLQKLLLLGAAAY
jgi:hypothetical protein